MHTVHACAHPFICACVCACACAHVHACVRGCREWAVLDDRRGRRISSRWLDLEPSIGVAWPVQASLRWSVPPPCLAAPGPCPVLLAWGLFRSPGVRGQWRLSSSHAGSQTGLSAEGRGTESKPRDAEATDPVAVRGRPCGRGAWRTSSPRNQTVKERKSWSARTRSLGLVKEPRLVFFLFSTAPYLEDRQSSGFCVLG